MTGKKEEEKEEKRRDKGCWFEAARRKNGSRNVTSGVKPGVDVVPHTVSIFIEFTSTHDFYILASDKRSPSTTDLLRWREGYFLIRLFALSLPRSPSPLPASLSFELPTEIHRQRLPPRQGVAERIGRSPWRNLNWTAPRCRLSSIESSGNPGDNRVAFVNENRPDCTLHRLRAGCQFGLISQPFSKGYVCTDVLDGWITARILLPIIRELLLEDVTDRLFGRGCIGFWIVFFERLTDSGVKLLLKYVANLS